jgi:hypothetical protein
VCSCCKGLVGARAPSMTTSEAHWENLGLELRVNRFAAAMAMIAAGTSADDDARERKPTVAKSSWLWPAAFAVGTNAPKGFLVAGLIAAKWVCAVPKMWP